jgi:hypothetical protein
VAWTLLYIINYVTISQIKNTYSIQQYGHVRSFRYGVNAKEVTPQGFCSGKEHTKDTWEEPTFMKLNSKPWKYSQNISY